jgi:hypothetical protein
VCRPAFGREGWTTDSVQVGARVSRRVGYFL